MPVLGEPELQIQEQVGLAPYTTMGIGGPARFFAEVTTEPALLEALRFARQERLPVLLLGGGSNLLVRDGGFPGLVIHLRLGGELDFAVTANSTLVRVPAGAVWDDLVSAVCERDLSGMECLAGIPGLTGATPIQNVGAYGQEVAQTIESVRVLDRSGGTFRAFSSEECGFSYRSSRFNGADRDRFVITAVTFRLASGGRAPLQYADLLRRFGDRRPPPNEVADAVREIRRGKGMLLVSGDPDCRSAGSFFKNPIVEPGALQRVAERVGVAPDAVPHWLAENGKIKLAAAWLLEQAGFHKGYQSGHAGISSRHTLALINRGGASFAELAALRDLVRETVEARFGVTLGQEPVEAGEPLPPPRASRQ